MRMQYTLLMFPDMGLGYLRARSPGLKHYSVLAVRGVKLINLTLWPLLGASVSRVTHSTPATRQPAQSSNLHLLLRIRIRIGLLVGVLLIVTARKSPGAQVKERLYADDKDEGNQSGRAERVDVSLGWR